MFKTLIMEDMLPFFIKYQMFIYPLIIIHLYLAVRFTIKAVQGDIENYNFLKMALVVFLPFVGYYIATKEEQEVT